MTYPNGARCVDLQGDRYEGVERRQLWTEGNEGKPHPQADESRVVKPPTHRLTRPTALPDNPNLPHVWVTLGGLKVGPRGGRARGGKGIEGNSNKTSALVSQRHTFTAAQPLWFVTLLPLCNLLRHREPGGYVVSMPVITLIVTVLIGDPDFAKSFRMIKIK